MASGVTNRGKSRLLEYAFAGVAIGTQYRWIWFDQTTTPTVDTNLDGDLTEVPAGNGYTAGGLTIAKTAGNFAVTQDNTNDRAEMDITDQTVTATGGPFPVSGTGARWGALCHGDAANDLRDLFAFFDAVSNRTVSDGQNLTAQNALIRIT